MRPLRALGRHRQAAVAPMMAVMAMPLLGMTALIVDTGFWIIGSTRLQIAADAAAMGAGFLLNTSLRTASASTQDSTLKTVALYEAQAAATKLMGTLDQNPTITVANSWSSVTVTLTSQAPAYFGNVFKVTAPVLRATATAGVPAPKPCVLTLGPTGVGIQVDNMGTVSAASCAIFSDSAGTPSIYLNSGTISGTAVGAVGTVTKSNSGSNTMNPSSPTSNSPSPVQDPNAGMAVPTNPSTPGACNYPNSSTNNYAFTGYKSTPYAFDAASSGGICVFQGNTTFGGNGSTDTFSAGVYYVVNGNLTFNNAAVTNANGVTFVMAGDHPGNFSWTNYSNTSIPFTAPTSGPTAGIAIWQGCNSNGGQTMSFQGGSTLNVTGSIYAPCSSVDAGNNAQLSAPLNKAFSIIAKSLYVHGSAAIRTSAGSGGSSSTGTPSLTN